MVIYATKSHAKKLLAHGRDVGYVAHETGFFDQPHFTQQFKRHYLVTPWNLSQNRKILQVSLP